MPRAMAERGYLRLKDNGNPPTRVSRSSNGCATCRLRKKRCPNEDIGIGDCSECLRHNIECLLAYKESRPDWLKNEQTALELKAAITAWIKEPANKNACSPLPLSPMDSGGTPHQPPVAHNNTEAQVIGAIFPGMAHAAAPPAAPGWLALLYNDVGENTHLNAPAGPSQPRNPALPAQFAIDPRLIQFTPQNDHQHGAGPSQYAHGSHHQYHHGQGSSGSANGPPFYPHDGGYGGYR